MKSNGGLIEDDELADEIVRRLNYVIAGSDAVRRDVGRVLDQRIEASPETARHPTIQCGGQGTMTVAALGIINGICGIDHRNKLPDYGYIASEWSDSGFVGFRMLIPVGSQAPHVAKGNNT